MQSSQLIKLEREQINPKESSDFDKNRINAMESKDGEESGWKQSTILWED